MQIVDLEEWSVLQAAHHHFLSAVEIAISGVEAEKNVTGTVAYVDKLEFLRYELQKLVISIPSHKRLDFGTIDQFKDNVVKLLRSFENALSDSLPMDQSMEQNKSFSLWENRFPNLHKLKRQHFMRFDRSESDRGSVVLRFNDSKYPWSSVLEALKNFNKSMESLFWTHSRETPLPKPVIITSSPTWASTRKRKVRDILEAVKNKVSQCREDPLQDHLMLLKLTDQIWKSAVEDFDTVSIFVSSCIETSSWQAVECSELE